MKNNEKRLVILILRWCWLDPIDVHKQFVNFRAKKQALKYYGYCPDRTGKGRLALEHFAKLKMSPAQVRLCPHMLRKNFLEKRLHDLPRFFPSLYKKSLDKKNF
jgi:hypothetical protein